MDGCFFILLIVTLGLVGFGAWRNLSNRLQRTEAELAGLELQLGVLRGLLDSRPIETEAGAPESEPPPPEPTAPPPIPALVPSEEHAPSPPEPPPPSPPRSEPPSSAPEPPPSPAIVHSILKVDWEQWVGVRGAAVLGGIVLALAALLFLKYSIEHGLIPPIVRVIAGVLAGIGAIWGSEVLRKRDYEATANALAGSGVVILYAAFWAANRLYGLISTVPAFGLMILVTVACGMLAWRYRSRVIAVLGLAGGFATPLLLATARDHPIGLFGYILLLDTGLLVLARRRRWPSLGILGLVATVFYQALWIFLEMKPEHQLLALLILAGFAALFAAVGTRAKDDSSAAAEARLWQVSQVAGVLLPFLFALHFAGNAELGRHLWAVAGLLVLLSLAAEWVARNQKTPLVGLGAAAADVAVVMVWVARTRFGVGLSWEAVAIAVALALCFHFFVELDLRRGGPTEGDAVASRAALVAAAGLFLILVGASLGPVPSFWPWLTGWLFLAMLLIRQSKLPGEAWRQVLAGALLGAGFALFYGVHATTLALPPSTLYFGLVIVVSAALQLLAYARASSADRRLSEMAAALPPAIVLLSLLVESMEPSLGVGLFYSTTIVLALLVVLTGTRLGEGRVLFASMAILSLEHLLWTVSRSDPGGQSPTVLLALGAQVAAMLLFVVWPFLTASHFARGRWAWYTAALAPPAWFLAIKELFESRFGSAAIGLLPLALSAVSLAAALRSRRIFALDDPRRRSNLAWFAAVALGFLSVAIPLQLDREWITIGWALEGIALVALWKYLAHPGLKYFGLFLLAAVTVRLVANPALLGYHPRTVWPIFNWLMYTYLVPAAALLGSGAILRRFELERVSSWERSVYARGYPVMAIGCGVAAVLVIFVWINLTIFDAFSPGTALQLTFDRSPARDLTLSLAWAVYALILLAFGMARRSQGLRWISLAFLVLTIGKVFLYDLGELKDLYRVASLMGLAVSLILVSLAYQRFVFRKRPGDSEE